MTGVPCILTDVGEISKYVTHKVNVFMVPPENPEKYAQMMEYILDNYDEALVIAQCAKKYIQDNFSTRAAGEKILTFIKDLRK